MAPQRLYSHHSHIVHNTPFLSPKFCITIVSNFSWVQWLGKISEGEQGALWSMWKKWINSRIMIIFLATKQNALLSIWNASVFFQMFFHFWTSFLNPDEVMQERFKIHPLWNYTCEAQFSNLVKPHSGTSDQSNQSPSQPVILTVSQDSYLITLLVNEWSASLSNSQSRQLSYPLTVSQESCLIIKLVNK